MPFLLVAFGRFDLQGRESYNSATVEIEAYSDPDPGMAVSTLSLVSFDFQIDRESTPPHHSLASARLANFEKSNPGAILDCLV